MTIEDVYEVLNYIADTDEQCADIVFYALTLLDTSVGNMLESVKHQIYSNLEQNNFTEVDPLTKYCKDITTLKDGIFTCLNTLVRKHPEVKIPDSDVVQRAVGNSDTPDSESKEPIDYSLYTVDNMEPHSLYEDFEHKKVCAYEFCGELIQVKSWRDLLISVCEKLNRENHQLFSSLPTNEKMNGKRLSYFVKQPTYTQQGKIRETHIPGTDFLVNTYANANTIAERVQKLLTFFEHDPRNFIVYLRADYSPLH